jgi:hypothetical protein
LLGSGSVVWDRRRLVGSLGSGSGSVVWDQRRFVGLLGSGSVRDQRRFVGLLGSGFVQDGRRLVGLLGWGSFPCVGANDASWPCLFLVLLTIDRFILLGPRRFAGFCWVVACCWVFGSLLGGIEVGFT